MPEDTRWLIIDAAPATPLALLVICLVATAFRLITGLWSNLDGRQVVYEHLLRSGWFHVENWIGLLLYMRQLSVLPAVRAGAVVLVLRQNGNGDQVLQKRFQGFRHFIWYTPGVAALCKAIQANLKLVYQYTNKGNTIAIVSDGTRVLGLDDISPKASLPVMEGKALLYKYMRGVDSVELMLDK